MSEVKIQAEPRTEFGKGAARRIRRADKVPAVLYGHGSDPFHISLPGHEVMLALKNANALLSVDVDGKPQLALTKQVQRDPLKGFIEHVDLLMVRRGEKVVVDIPVVLVGDADPDALVYTDNATISVEAEATHIPESVEVSVEGLEIGSQVHAKDLTLPSGCELQVDDELLIVNVTAAPTAEEIETELAEAEAEAGGEVEEVPAEVAEEAPATKGEAGGGEAAESE